MKSLVSYFKAGNIYLKADKIIDLQVTRIKDLTDIIIPFFDKYPIVGVKAKDFSDWCEIAEIIKAGEHLTEEGLEKIHIIYAL